ncbi:sugar ABC transporter substrate-binding protein [Kitasatospora herbaricolor]|uniref:Substrate-binding domain-containing protein n=1 Tax=Kitasatospora herbaricolor TaxID=68217 RepID=A0ABZ1WJ14_9ACTN|nr:substrate-binding domain-containing protein [Kitasatospora herbaricolor]
MDTATRLLLSAVLVSTILPLTACGQERPPEGGPPTPVTVGLLLPNTSSTRYESFDRPLIEAAVTGLCSRCTVAYANAEGQENIQRKQFDDLLAKGAQVIILDPVNAAGTASWVDAAARKGTKVVSYDRLAAGKVTAYVSFDSERTGELQGKALLDALGPKAATANVVMINGADGDPNTPALKAGAHQALDGKVKSIPYEQSGDWKPETAARRTAEAVRTLGKGGFQAVYSANDAMAGAIIETLRSSGMSGLPVGGQDASIDAVRRVLADEQAYTIYKPYRQEAEAAGDVTAYLLNGLNVSAVAQSVTKRDGDRIPSLLLTPVLVTKANVASTVIAGGLYSAAEICAGQYESLCLKAGLR